MFTILTTREIPIDSRKAIKTIREYESPFPRVTVSSEIPIDSRKAIKTLRVWHTRQPPALCEIPIDSRKAIKTQKQIRQFHHRNTRVRFL